MSTTVKDFTIESKLISLIKLQKIDSKIDEINFIRGELPAEVNDLKDELDGLATRKTHTEEEINGMKKFIEEKELFINDSKTLIKKYDKQSQNVKNNREYEAIHKEIEFQTLEVKLAEKHIKNANEEMVEKLQELESVKKVISQKNVLFQTKQTELEKILEETDIEEKEYLKKSEKAKKEIQDTLLNSYERIRKSYRNGKAIVSVDRESCSGCHTILPPQLQSEIGYHKKIVLCENCGRILSDKELFDSVK